MLNEYPNFMKAFKKTENWVNWSSLFQADGGSIDF